MPPLDLSDKRFWAKTVATQPGLDVFPHCRNVGLVASLLGQAKSPLLQAFRLSPAVVAALAALHDIGKISQGFQVKCPAWLEKYGWADLVSRDGWRECESDHAKVSQFTVARLLRRLGWSDESAACCAMAVGAHHGRPVDSESDRLKARLGMCADEWEAKRQAVADRLIASFGSMPDPDLNEDTAFPMLWWLAGLISVADWIGSDEHFFSNQFPSDKQKSQQFAAAALAAIGLIPDRILPHLAFENLFSLDAPGQLSRPRPLQTAAIDLITEPGIYAIEAPMGMGKTEAALWCAYRLIEQGKADGLYFALPTQVTSNRIHLRVAQFLARVYEGGQRVRLIHAHSWLREELGQPTLAASAADGLADDDARAGRDWFASGKRALLAPFGVGTVDQALMAVLGVKHFFVRHFALARKVVIIDEVHSYDVYTGTLIQSLCHTLRQLGCTVILLSATLTASRRAKLLGLPMPEQEAAEEAYPLISGLRHSGQPLAARSVPPQKGQAIYPSFVSAASALQAAWQAAQAGACVLWICNTIGSAQAVWRWFARQGSGPALGLLHSRFPHFRREALEGQWMETLGKNSRTGGGCVLVATQVVEQSVDLDADLLITELAPTDMLLQRIGRLWRHARAARPLARPECWIIAPSDDFAALRSSDSKTLRASLLPHAYVYAPYVLLRSWQVWQSLNVLNLPGDIRRMLIDTYSPLADEPAAWQELRAKLAQEGKVLEMRAHTAGLPHQALTSDVEGVASTRVNGQKTVGLILARSASAGRLELINGEIADLAARYHLGCARALHRNLVQVPKWVFDQFVVSRETAQYVFGEQAVAVVAADGALQLAGVRAGYGLSYSAQLGLAVQSNERKDHESGF